MQDKSLVTVVLAETGREWTMSVMEGEDDDGTLTRDRLNAAISLVANDGVELYGCWGGPGAHKTYNQVVVAFPPGTRVLAAYQYAC